MPLDKEAPSKAHRGPLDVTVGRLNPRRPCLNTTLLTLLKKTQISALITQNMFNFCFCVQKQVGTLDVLVGLSDELAKLDSFVEGYATC